MWQFNSRVPTRKAFYRRKSCPEATAYVVPLPYGPTKMTFKKSVVCVPDLQAINKVNETINETF